MVEGVHAEVERGCSGGGWEGWCGGGGAVVEGVHAELGRGCCGEGSAYRGREGG